MNTSGATADRAAFLDERRAVGPRRMDELFAPGYDEHWGGINATHHSFLFEFIELTRPGSLLLDAACGTGKYLPAIISAGRRVQGVDRSAGMLRELARKFPDADVTQLALERLGAVAGWAGRFGGVLCVDAMENVPPEDWPVVLAGFARVLRAGAPLYLTVEIPEGGDREAAAHPVAPLVTGEVLWPDEHGGGYHYYPAAGQVVTWLGSAGFEIVHAGDGDGYRHYLARLTGALG